MLITLKAPASLNQDTFDNCGQWKDAPTERRVVNLRRGRFFDSYALVTLLTVVTLWVSHQIEVRLVLPASKSALTYLARMHFFDLLPEGVECDSPYPSVQERRSMLLELRRLDVQGGEHAVDKLCEFVYPQLPRQLAGDFTVALAEIGSNVVQHAATSVGFVAAQRFEKDFQSRPGPRLQLVVGDAGIGIRQSLAEARPDVAQMTDEDAILLAIQDGVTGKPGTNSGVGLSTARDYADAFQGVFRVRSGEGMLLRRRRVQFSRGVPGLPGTIVAVELASPGRRR